MGLAAVFLSALAVLANRAESGRPPAVPTIAVIPQASGTMLWEVERAGANAAAESVKAHLYWNAPTSENDVAGQGSLIDKVSGGEYQGLVLAPNHPRAILAPLRRALDAGFPVVVVASPLDLPPAANLTYVLNDDEMMGALAAAEIARLIHGRGSIALLGLGRHAPGVMRRAFGAERFLATNFPEVQIVGRFGGAYSLTRSEELATEVVELHRDLRAVLSFTATSARGVHSALKSRSLQNSVRLVGCEQDSDLIAYVATGEVAAIAAENTYRMGYEAVKIISSALAGKAVRKTLLPTQIIPPLLITRENLNSPEVVRLINYAR